jgi:hypothetical protein
MYVHLVVQKLMLIIWFIVTTAQSLCVLIANFLKILWFYAMTALTDV